MDITYFVSFPFFFLCLFLDAEVPIVQNDRAVNAMASGYFSLLLFSSIFFNCCLEIEPGETLSLMIVDKVLEGATNISIDVNNQPTSLSERNNFICPSFALLQPKSPILS